MVTTMTIRDYVLHTCTIGSGYGNGNDYLIIDHYKAINTIYHYFGFHFTPKDDSVDEEPLRDTCEMYLRAIAMYTPDTVIYAYIGDYGTPIDYDMVRQIRLQYPPEEWEPEWLQQKSVIEYAPSYDISNHRDDTIIHMRIDFNDKMNKNAQRSE